MVNSPFHKKHSFSKRKSEAQRVLDKYPNKVPIIVQKLEKSILPDLKKTKYLVPIDLTICQFMYVIRKRIKLQPEKSMILFVNNKMAQGSMLISQVYNEEKDNDLFLYCYITQESTFG